MNSERPLCMRWLVNLRIRFFFCLLAFSSSPLIVWAEEGIHYRHLVLPGPQSVHIIEVEPDKYTMMPVWARDMGSSRKSVLELARKCKAAAGINGGFFKMGGKLDGVPAGALKINGRWISTPAKPRGAIGWANFSQTILFDRLLTQCSLVMPEGKHLVKVLPQCIFSPETCKQWEAIDNIVGGTPLLIHEGTVIDDFSAEGTRKNFLTKRHARTAFGVLKNKHWILVVVDGKQPGYSLGMTMPELTALMHSLGCINALNLDGGGSSTMVFKNRVVNQPYGDDDEDENLKKVRRVSDALLIFKR